MPKTEKQVEKEQTLKRDAGRTAAGDDADTAHLREAKRAFNRTVERQAKRQYERQVAG